MVEIQTFTISDILPPFRQSCWHRCRRRGKVWINILPCLLKCELCIHPLEWVIFSRIAHGFAQWDKFWNKYSNKNWDKFWNRFWHKYFTQIRAAHLDWVILRYCTPLICSLLHYCMFARKLSFLCFLFFFSFGFAINMFYNVSNIYIWVLVRLSLLYFMSQEIWQPKKSPNGNVQHSAEPASC